MQEENSQKDKKEIEENLSVLGSCEWVREEFSLAVLNDLRLYSRLLVVASDLVSNPSSPINQASGQWNKAKAAYRFFDNDKVTKENVLMSHIAKTTQRIKDHTGVVLALEDTCFLNYSHMKSSTDLGNIGGNSEYVKGLIFHSRYAVTEQGLPLGFIHQNIWSRKDKENSEINKTEEVEVKESQKWIIGLIEQEEVFGRNNNIVGVCDRECDFYEFFEKAMKLEQNYVVRAKYDRTLDSNKLLWESFESEKPNFSYKMTLPQTNEEINLEVKYKQIIFSQKDKTTTIKNVSAIYVDEINPPKDREPISWMLLTTLTVNSEATAKKIIGYYKQRWKIEILHKIMKSGCNIELMRLEVNKRRFPYIALKAIIASRLLLITHYNKILPHEPASSILTATECAALYATKHNKIDFNATFNTEKAVRWLAELGGYLSRRADPLPGPTHVWRGWQRLQDSTKMLGIVKNSKNIFA